MRSRLRPPSSASPARCATGSSRRSCGARRCRRRGSTKSTPRGRPIEEVGDHELVVDSAGRGVAMIETTEVVVQRMARRRPRVRDRRGRGVRDARGVARRARPLLHEPGADGPARRAAGRDRRRHARRVHAVPRRRAALAAGRDAASLARPARSRHSHVTPARYVVFDGDGDDTLGKGDEPRGGLGPAASRRQAFHDPGGAARDERGERLVRFSYATDGTARRGPVTLRERDLAKLARSRSGATPELGDRRLGGAGWRRRLTTSTGRKALRSTAAAQAGDRETASRSRAAAISPSRSGTPAGRAEQRVDRVLGMRHQAEHVAGLVRDAGDPVAGAVDVVACSAARSGRASTTLGEERRRRRPSFPRRA